jgi:hypothetical protein
VSDAEELTGCKRARGGNPQLSKNLDDCFSVERAEELTGIAINAFRIPIAAFPGRQATMKFRHSMLEFFPRRYITQGQRLLSDCIAQFLVTHMIEFARRSTRLPDKMNAMQAIIAVAES